MVFARRSCGWRGNRAFGARRLKRRWNRRCREECAADAWVNAIHHKKTTSCAPPPPHMYTAEGWSDIQTNTHTHTVTTSRLCAACICGRRDYEISRRPFFASAIYVYYNGEAARGAVTERWTWAFLRRWFFYAGGCWWYGGHIWRINRCGKDILMSDFAQWGGKHVDKYLWWQRPTKSTISKLRAF